MAAIHFFSEQIKFSIKRKTEIRNWILLTLKSEGKKLGEINYVFCNDAFLLQINISYLKHNTLTDIITFPVYSDNFHITETKNTDTVSGDIYISTERVNENAKKFSNNFEQELHRVLIHGVLHLCGYGDKSPKEKLKMREKEEFYLSKL